MNSERSVIIVMGHRAAYGKLPDEITSAQLTATVAFVLSRYRSDHHDMFLDHPLWIACTRAVTESVLADETHVFAEARPRLVDRIMGRRVCAEIGSLEVYSSELRQRDQDAQDWERLVWRRQGQPVAVALCEPWYRCGGPDLHHDSYTTCVFVPPGVVSSLVATVQKAVAEEGGWVENVVDLGVKPMRGA